MKYVTGQFVCLPRVIELNKLIKYTDLVVYIAVRSFNNKDNNCYPSYETIAKRAGCGRTYAIEAIKRLEAFKLLEIKRAGKIKVVNKYKFTDSYMFEQIPYQLFDEDLTLNEKAMLLWLRQHVNCVLTIPYKLKRLSELLKIGYKVVHQQTTALIRKGYLQKYYLKGKQWGYQLTNKIDWPTNYTKHKSIVNSPIIVC